jgi:hypothetical protein
MVEEQTRYKYEDLDEEAQERVRQWWYEHGAEHDWYENVYECATENGKDLGFGVGRINFSGFYSQGDGACWSGHVDIVEWLRTHTEDSIAREAWIQLISEGWADKNMTIGYGNSHYSHSGTMSVGYWEGLIGDPDSIKNIKEEDRLMQRESIFQGMNALDLLNLITTSDFEYKSMADLAEAIEQSARDYADEIYDLLKNEYEYITSEANLIEMCEINDWRFDDEGRGLV